MKNKTIIMDSSYKITIADVYNIAFKNYNLEISSSGKFKAEIQNTADFVQNNLAKTGAFYGVTTGYGDNCTQSVSEELTKQLPINLTRFHGCGLGKFLTPEQTRAVMVVRLRSLSLGYSGVSYDLLKFLENLLAKDVLPVIPSEGSVGASGDLTPLSYIAAVMLGERQVWYQGKILPTAQVFSKLGIKAIILKPKEALALMNGTSVMTALAAEVYTRANYLMLLAARLTALTSIALKGNPEHFEDALFKMKPHQGQMQIAKFIKEDLSLVPKDGFNARLQDRYSTRCAPHVIGVLADMLPTFKKLIETEINSANDNPLIDPVEEKIFHGGHFYGGHIAFVMDSIKNLVANIADLLDRQFATIVDPKFNNGLAVNLSGAVGAEAQINHGLKALQISTSAWTAEALKNTLAASIFSRSTESHNQDKVSMGTIAARDAIRVLELTEQVIAAHIIATAQAIRLRLIAKEISTDLFTGKVQKYLDSLEMIPFIKNDMPLDSCLLNLIKKIRKMEWSLEL